MSEATPSFAAVFDEDSGEDATTGLFAQSAATASVDYSDMFGASGTGVGALPDHGEITPRFDGDTGQLPAEACWAMQELIAAPYISVGNKKHWSAMMAHSEHIRSRLSELNLVLEINDEHGYAFTRQADDPNPQARAILKPRTLSLAASTLALYLYNQYIIAPEDAVVEKTDMVDHLLHYKPANDTDELGFRRRTDAAIKTLEDLSIIKAVKGSENRRFVVHGVITSILSAERVEALTARYAALAAGGAAPVSAVRGVDGGATDSDGLEHADG